ncbi:MAG TPA: IgA Peptidase M64 [Terriglobales bacterium]|nr:IgA Peptidase M64 [Terriglobales bacterium]
MIRKLALFVLFTTVAMSAATNVPRTMRLDYFHTGNANQEMFSFDQVVLEPLPFPGNPAKPIDESNLGKYIFEVRDRASNKLLYSRGFASIYGEWETTDEAKTLNRTFSESLRFPAPEKPVQVVLKKRDELMAFHEVWSVNIDPKDKFIDRSTMKAPANLIELQKSGDPTVKVDFLILGDGYTAAEMPKFEKDARRLMDILFSTSPFKEHRADFNVWGLCPPAEQSGISRPSTGIYRKSPVGATYDAFDSERYVLTFDNKAFRTIAQFAPYDVVEILTNTNTYGGGGIFNLYSTVAADSGWSPYVFVHEFGHHFAGLGDEYYTSDVSYAPATKRIEPWDPNVTALLDKKDFKWADMVSPGTPLPTPWNKEAFSQYSHSIQKRRREIRAQNRPEAEMDALFAEELKHEDEMLGAEKYAGKVGAFEGALYEAKGYYRPEVNCIMFTRHNQFCSVCKRAIERVIAMYTGS